MWLTKPNFSRLQLDLPEGAELLLIRTACNLEEKLPITYHTSLRPT